LHHPVVNIVTLGCSKNLVDSELIARQLELNNFNILFDSNSFQADIVIINTCGFIQDAKEESINTIIDFEQAKSFGDIKKIYVIGCLSERYSDELKKEFPQIDGFFGKFDFKSLLGQIKADLYQNRMYERKITTPSHYAYLKISEGCNRTCSFCAIPVMTGRYKSKPIDEITAEAEYLAQRGVKELLVIAQDLSYYGYDLYESYKLPDLIKELSDIEGIEWIKLHYAYPVNFPAEILDVMASNRKVCRYLDIAFQHCSDNVLQAMRRKTSKQQTIDLIHLIREKVPGIHLRTTIMVGHPGETEDDFGQLVDFVREMRFERLGGFTYSHEENTYAHRQYKDYIPPDIKQQRLDTIMNLQSEIFYDMNKNKIGKTFRALIDREEGDFLIGRTEFDSPEIDGEVIIKKKDFHIQPGGFYPVRITSTDQYDLYGKIIHE
jgi:ribosomal protein S12 methylthiotransferase